MNLSLATDASSSVESTDTGTESGAASGTGAAEDTQNSSGETASTSGDEANSEDVEKNPSDAGAACNDEKQNGQESDVDCGGPDCAGCRVGQACVQAEDCRSSRCVEGRCAKALVTCSSNADCNDKNPCTQDVCTEQKRCENPVLPDGQACNDANACTRADKCVQGRCEGVDTRVFREDFSKSPHAFLNGSKDEYRHWEIGPAKASTCAVGDFVNDPAQDHTQDGANGVMGVLIGGCQSTKGENLMDCAWSDYIDVSGFESDILFSYWRHLSSPGRKPVNPPRLPIVTNSIYYRVPGATSAQLIEEGWYLPVIDKTWTYIQHRVPAVGLDKVSFGICYKRVGSTGEYPGWTVDDVRVRQFGCEMDAP